MVLFGHRVVHVVKLIWIWAKLMWAGFMRMLLPRTMMRMRLLVVAMLMEGMQRRFGLVTLLGLRMLMRHMRLRVRRNGGLNVLMVGSPGVIR